MGQLPGCHPTSEQLKSAFHAATVHQQFDGHTHSATLQRAALAAKQAVQHGVVDVQALQSVQQLPALCENDN